jgi:tripartite-type tricarboxylate transporter receptor subunit TctC
VTIMALTKLRLPACCGTRRDVMLAWGVPLCLLSALVGSGLAQGQTYPAKPIRLVMGFPAGSNVDTIVRPVAQRMSEMLGQSIVIDNHSGAGGVLGSDLVAKSVPDGYTLLATPGTAMTSTPHMQGKMPYDALNDFAPVAQVAVFSSVLVVNPGVPARNIRELIALARARPGVLTYASVGVGSGPHLNAALFNSMAKITMLHVPYRGTPQAYADLIGGRIDVMFSTPAVAVPQIRAGKLRALGVAGMNPNPMLPEVPTIASAGLPEYQTTGWQGLFAPARTPKAVIDRLNATVAKAVSMPDLQELLIAQGNEVAILTAEEFAAKFRDEYAMFGKLIKASGIQPE